MHVPHRLRWCTETLRDLGARLDSTVAAEMAAIGQSPMWGRALGWITGWLATYPAVFGALVWWALLWGQWGVRPGTAYLAVPAMVVLTFAAGRRFYARTRRGQVRCGR